jgi:hypothetical protein
MRFLGYLKMWERPDGQTQCGKLYHCDEVAQTGRPICWDLAAISRLSAISAFASTIPLFCFCITTLSPVLLGVITDWRAYSIRKYSPSFRTEFSNTPLKMCLFCKCMPLGTFSRDPANHFRIKMISGPIRFCCFQYPFGFHPHCGQTAPPRPPPHISAPPLPTRIDPFRLPALGGPDTLVLRRLSRPVRVRVQLLGTTRRGVAEVRDQCGACLGILPGFIAQGVSGLRAFRFWGAHLGPFPSTRPAIAHHSLGESPLVWVRFHGARTDFSGWFVFLHHIRHG